MFRVQKPSFNERKQSDPQPQGPQSRKPESARSCLACHRRKVRCDRGSPCTNCSRCGFTCAYPSKENHGKVQTLQHISGRLERLENMIIRLSEVQGSELPATEPETQIDQEQSENIPSSSTRNLHDSWELLLNDGQGVHYVNNSNIKDLLQDVRQDYKIEIPLWLRKVTNIPLGRENQRSSANEFR